MRCVFVSADCSGSTNVRFALLRFSARALVAALSGVDSLTSAERVRFRTGSVACCHRFRMKNERLRAISLSATPTLRSSLSHGAHEKSLARRLYKSGNRGFCSLARLLPLRARFRVPTLASCDGFLRVRGAGSSACDSRHTAPDRSPCMRLATFARFYDVRVGSYPDTSGFSPERQTFRSGSTMRIYTGLASGSRILRFKGFSPQQARGRVRVSRR